MKENPEEEFAEETPSNSSFEVENTPVDEEVVTPEVVSETELHSQPESELNLDLKKRVAVLHSSGAVPVAGEFEGIAANGGAVGSFVLGIWAVLGALLTPWSVINGILGFLLGIWGLTSKRPRTAWIGIIISLAGIVLAMAEVSSIISRAFIDPDL